MGPSRKRYVLTSRRSPFGATIGKDSGQGHILKYPPRGSNSNVGRRARPKHLGVIVRLDTLG
jgi:hypothetical protein